MNYRKFFPKTVFLVFPILLLLLLGGAAVSTRAQSVQFAPPREQTLLNGLKLLVWQEASAPKVTVKLRIHSGAAFDPQNKMGVTALLGDIFFPTEQARAFFTEDLEGGVEVTTNYDYIQITATGKPDEALSMLETIAAAVIKPQITDENFKIVRDARLKKVQELEKNPAYVADRAVAKRLFGEFPYGRSIEGTSASLAAIDRPDLLFAKERFLTADNATLVIVGNIKPDYAHRAARQLFGVWTKADKKVPATFRQPDEPQTNVETINSEFSNQPELRRAWRANARSAKDYAAARLLAQIWSNRLGSEGKIEFNPYFLPGYFNLKISAAPDQSAFPAAAENLLKTVPDQAEFDRAKAEVLNGFTQKHPADLWLDVDTYKLASVKKDYENIQSATLADAIAAAEKFKNETAVTVVLTKSPGGAAQQPE